jgi:hypothetical protein
MRPARAPALRAMGIIAASVLALLAIIVVIAGISSVPRTPAQQEELRKAAERDARVDTLISQSGPSALPPIPKPSYYTSSSATIPATIPTISIATPSPLPRYQPTLQPAAAPPAEVPATILPTNNEILYDAYPESTFRGELSVDNGTSSHAVAKLIDVQTDQKVLSFVIGARRKSTIYAIPDGTYQLIFAFGDRLYVGTDRFQSPRGFSKFVKHLTFETRSTDDAIYWSQLSVTLHPVFAGNAKTSSISQKEFERY